MTKWNVKEFICYNAEEKALEWIKENKKSGSNKIIVMIDTTR